MSKPVFKEGLFKCPSCGSKDTVALDESAVDPQDAYCTIIWCCCGKVSVRNGAHEIGMVYDFFPVPKHGNVVTGRIE